MRQKISWLRSHQALSLGLPLLVALLALPALRPLTLPGLLSGHDSSLHLFRFVELHRLIVSGDYFPRWFPDLSLGHGYPLLNYYPPLTYYLFEAFHLLGFAFVNAIDLTMALGVILSGLGMYCFGLQVSGRRSVALLAAIAFMYMPYRLVDIYVRGAWAEATAFAFIPWLFASFYALATRRSITYLLTSALLLAGLFLTHQVSIYFVPVLFVYSLAVALRSSYPRKGIALIAVAMFSGLAASAFYWFPAMAEVSFASTENFILSDLSPAQRLMLVPFDLIIQPQLLYHFGAPPFQMGLVEAVAAFSGLSILLAVFARGRREFLPVLVLPAAAVLLACLMTPFSSFFFEKVLVANSIQFAYRLLALIGTFAAVCTGFLAFPRRLGTYLAVAVGGVLVFAATCSLPVSHEEVPDYGLSLGMASRYEITRYRPGLSHENEWLPLVANLGAGQSPQEVAPLSQTTVEMMGPLAYRFKTAADAATSLRYHAYAFPGWQAKVDGQAVAVYPSQPLGLVSVDVPSGNHTVDLWFTDTPARTVGRIITIAALLALAIVSLARGRRWKAGYYWGFSLLALIAIPVAADFLPRAPAVMGQALSLNGQRPMQADFGQVIRLAGFELKSPSIEEGWDAEAVVYWQALRGEAHDVTALFEWVDEQGTAFPAADGEILFGTAHLQEWLPNEVVRDVRRLVLPRRPLQKLSLRLTVALNGQKLGTSELGTLNGLPARSASSKLEDNPTLADFAGKMGLVGFEVIREESEKGSLSGSTDRLLATVKPGDEVQVNLWWRGLAPSNVDYKVFVHLYDRSFLLLAQHDRQPGDVYGTTSLWQRTEIYQDPHTVAIPPATKPGVYRLEVGAYVLETMTRLKLAGSDRTTAYLGRIKVSPTPSAGSPANRLDATFGGALNLEGYELAVGTQSNGPGGQRKLGLTLYWQVAGEVKKDYKVFVHLLDSAGTIVTQTDSEPVDGNYPTSYWQKGEKFPDQYSLTLAANDLGRIQSARVGFYDPATGSRLTLATGADSLIIPLTGLVPE